MASIFKIFILSFTDLQAYPQLVRRSLKSVIAYCFTFYFIFSVVNGWYQTRTFLPRMYETIQNLTSDLNQLPPDLTLALTEQMTLQTSNVSLPYSLPLSHPLGAATQLVVIDPHAVAEDIKARQSLVLLTPNTLAFTLDPTKPVTGILPWKDLGINFSITGQMIIHEANRIFSWFQSLRPYLLPLTIASLFITYLAIRFTFVFFNLLFLYLISYLFGNRLSFTTYLKTGLYTLVLTEVLWQTLSLLYANPSPLFFSFTFYLLTVIALSSLTPREKNA